MTDRIRTLLGALCAVVLCVALCAPAAWAQGAPSPNRSAFEPVDLPDPNVYRAADGRPGDQYWQQRADYAIDVTLDPEQHRLSGRVSITYTNNAPRALDYLWVQLDQNLFKPGSRGASVVPADARFSGFFAEGGYDIESITVERGSEAASEPEYTIDDTRMRIALQEPLEADGGTLTINVDYSFVIPEYGADRMGRLEVDQGTVYELAQWYPRMYVYDDVHGWNPLPYLGQGEYYLEYGDFEVDITVPREYIAAATGVLQNPGEVLTETQRRRLDRARESRETVAIIGRTEVGAASTRPDGDGPLTWRFRAESVRDFAWAASDAFIWDAATANAQDTSVLAMSVYPKEGLGTEQNPGWEQSTRFVQHSIEHYSEKWAPYPYPVAINVAGVVRGMEYPQIAFCSVEARGRGLFGVTDHEFGHSWFPMLVGSDERRWAWMDEGLNSFINVYSTDAFYDDSTQASLRVLSRLVASNTQASHDTQPIMTQADRIEPARLGYLAYRKPAAGFMLLREYILGPELFDPAFQAFIDRWSYRHPKPADLFRTIEDVAGEDLDWFWRGWFYETDALDQAVREVTHNADSVQTRITVAHNGELMMPITVAITYADGTTEERRVPVEAFYTSDAHQFVVAKGRTVTEVQLDPHRILPDVDRRNNRWRRDDASRSTSSSQETSSQED